MGGAVWGGAGAENMVSDGEDGGQEFPPRTEEICEGKGAHVANRRRDVPIAWENQEGPEEKRR